MEKAVFSAEIQELHRMLEWVRLHLARRGLEMAAIRKLELASEEALVNVMHHGYQGKKGKVEIRLQFSSGRVEIAILDWGPPFDPVANAPQVDPSAPLEMREEGGLGIFLIQQIVDEIVYRRENDANVFIMIKRFSQTK